MILKGFAVDEEAVVVVEVERVELPVWSRLRSGWAGPGGLSGWAAGTSDRADWFAGMGWVWSAPGTAGWRQELSSRTGWQVAW